MNKINSRWHIWANSGLVNLVTFIHTVINFFFHQMFVRFFSLLLVKQIGFSLLAYHCIHYTLYYVFRFYDRFIETFVFFLVLLILLNIVCVSGGFRNRICLPIDISSVAVIMGFSFTADFLKKIVVEYLRK